ncbi:MAG TPA: UDP-N-acetylmuramoyl-tripeptide--D-alanyl-D-alanine ligase [Patescibacteria group bacterium]|nr:UDP-N-acetylmuramoyl-tripeptide--D-alanyl-D-alanine ligase [Patescibacteria group bacterium]
MRKILQLKLKILAKLILKKYKPKVVGITGSNGKTSTKEAISHVLKEKFNIRTSYKNYNNEIGLPLTIIGCKSPGKSYLSWFLVFIKALGLLLIKNKKYPEILVLEMGIDRPGDMSYLLSIVKPDIAIVTSVSYSHLEYFGSINNIKKEKQLLVEALPASGLAILNYDNIHVKEMAEICKSKVVGYGVKDEQAILKTQDIAYNFTKGRYELTGVTFKLNYQGAVVPVNMKNIISEPGIYAALAAFAVASNFEISILDTSSYLNNFSLPPGRMNVLPGIKHSFIIDDTYNSSPEAAISAIDILGRISVDDNTFKYAVMGDMLEIGAYTIEGHRLVGKKIHETNINFLIAVGERARDFIRGAKDSGMNEANTFYFDHQDEAGRFLQNRLKEGDIILVKGSQGARMEIVVKELMAEPERANKLLVRQEKKWLKN